MNLSKNAESQRNLQQKLDNFFENNFFDVQGMSFQASLDEAYLARLLTKLAIGSATVWWSLLEVKDFFVLRRKSKF